MLSSVALEEYFWPLRVLIVLTDEADHTRLTGAEETLLEYQDKPREDAGGAGDEGHGCPLAQDHPLLSEVEQHHQHLDGEEEEDGDAEDDEVLVVEDVVVVLELGPVHQEEGRADPDDDEEAAGDVEQGKPLHQLVLTLGFPLDPAGKENVEETSQPNGKSTSTFIAPGGAVLQSVAEEELDEDEGENQDAGLAVEINTQEGQGQQSEKQ